ncbi:nuclear pore complex protein NUP98A-like, partial [Syzygium oleosum]|uniref:nuclear pore complex protein NUP98A-like n=1 Tax=Syzygium oleosum TaxID=219896 RepID=UPI0024BA2396
LECLVVFRLTTFNAESKESSPNGLAPSSMATGISPFTKSGCPSFGGVFGLDGPVRHPFGGLSSPFANDGIFTTTALGTSTFSNPSSGPPIMLASTVPAHNSSAARFGTPFSFSRSASISGTMSSDTGFCTRGAATPGGGSIFLHKDHFPQPPTFSFSTPNTTATFRPPSCSTADCGALPEPEAFITSTSFGPQKPTTTVMHNFFGFPNATSTCFNSQPTPFWNSPFKSCTQRDGGKISNSASPFGPQTDSRGKTTAPDYAPTPAPEERTNGKVYYKYMSISAMPSNKDRSHEELRWERHESKESKQESSSEGFAPFAAISNPFATRTATKPSVSSGFVTPFSQPYWFTPSATASSGGPSSNTACSVTNPSVRGGSICQHNASTQPPAFSFPNTAATAFHFGPPRNSAPGGESTNVPKDSGTKRPGGGFIPPTPFGPLTMTAQANSTVFDFPSTPFTQNTRPSKFRFKSKIEGDSRKMRTTPTICSSCRQIEASRYAPTPAPTESQHTESTSVSATPDNKHNSPEEIRWQCQKSKEKGGEQVDPVSEMASHEPHSFFPVMMLPVIPARTHSFGAFPWNTISGPCTGFYAPTLLGSNVPVLLVPSNSMGLNCFPTTVSGENYFQAMPAAIDSLSEMFRRL